jgi:hypothetical protein
MAFVLKDRVHEGTTVTGTGSATLLGAVAGFQTFGNVMSVGDTCWYTIIHASTAWETGIGTYSGTNTLARTTVIESSNSGALVSFAAGSKDVFIGFPASRALTVDFAQTFSLAQKAQARSNLSVPIYQGHLFGLGLSAAGSTATFGVAAGQASNSTATDVMSLGSAITKITTAWVVGTGNGGIDTGTVAINTWYHVHIIKRLEYRPSERERYAG